MISRFNRIMSEAERVLMDARNASVRIRPGVLLVPFANLLPGDLIIHRDSIRRVDALKGDMTGSGRLVMHYSGLTFNGPSFRLLFDKWEKVQRLEMLDLQDIQRFIDGRGASGVTYACDGNKKPAERQQVNGLHERRMTPAERERKRRDNETPEQSAERRRKNAENMRKKRAGK